jgi:hypothetical protein
MPVLAVFAVKIASHAAQRVGDAAGKKMEERFFFNGIHSFRTDFPIGHRIERSCDIFSHPADAEPPVLDAAAVAAQ